MGILKKLEDPNSFVISKACEIVVLIPQKLRDQINAFFQDSHSSIEMPDVLRDLLAAYLDEYQRATALPEHLLLPLITMVENYKRVLSLPNDAKDELTEYLHLPPGSAHPRNGICLWFDEVNRTCKHYDLRPSICRDFEVGSEGCLNWRKQYQDTLV